MANTLLTISKITNESLRVLKNNLAGSAGINKEYSKEFANKGAKIGSVINIRKPVRFTVRTGRTLDIQDVTDQSVALTLDTQAGVDFQFTSQDMALSIDEFSDRYIKPAVATIANKIDYDVMSLYKQVSNSVGTPGTVPNDLTEALDAGRKMKELGCPVDDNWWHIVNPECEAAVVNGLSGKFQAADEIAKQYKKGMMGMAAGFMWKMDQNVRQHTTGAFSGGTPLVNGASQSGASLITDGWSSGATTVKEGDVFTIANVYAINPQSRESTGVLQQFTITADNSDTTGDMTLAISPSIVTSGPYQNVSAAPADNAAITMLGSASTAYPQNMAFHKDAFTLGSADLPLPGGVDMAARASDSASGLSIRLVRQYDIREDVFPCRLDILYGVKAIYPQLACRVWG